MTNSITAQAGLMSVEQAANMIREGLTLLIAGDEELLRQLPSGQWIGGTIPYFMAESGGLISREQVFVHILPNIINSIQIKNYSVEHLPKYLVDAPDNGFSIILLPAGSAVHASYACNAPDYEGMFLKPVIGWITGTHLNDLDKITPKVFNGNHNLISDQEAVVLHAQLPLNFMASISIINLFTQGTGETIVFPKTGFHAQECTINGKNYNLAEYLQQNTIDTRLPLVANYYGAMINVSFQSIDQNLRQVKFYAPVFEGIEYKLAAPLTDYITQFQTALPQQQPNLIFSCNCILNFLYSELESKKTGKLIGPITFGEIAYQLLNQTLVYLTVEPK